MENELPLQEQVPEQPPKQPLSRFLTLAGQKKSILFGLGILALLSMGTYAIIAPSQDIRSVAAIPSITPPAPTYIPDTPTPAPTTPLPTSSTSLPSPTKKPTPTKNPNTPWKTFVSTKYGYSIKYDPDWTVRDLGVLEPKIPSYINFHPNISSDSSRFITLSVTTRTYQEQLALGASSSAITVSGIKGTKQFFRDSDGNTSTVVILPRKKDLIVLRAKTIYHPIFDIMLSTLVLTTR